jgi:hypothetical protein
VCSDVPLWERGLAHLETLPASLLAEPLRRVAALKARFASGLPLRAGVPPYPEHVALADDLRRGQTPS